MIETVLALNDTVVIPAIFASAVVIVLGILAIIEGRKALAKISVNWKLRNLFRKSVSKLPTVSRPVSIFELPNIRRAVEAFAADGNGKLETLTAAGDFHSPNPNTQLKHEPPRYSQVEVDFGKHESCLMNPLYFIEVGEDRFAVKSSVEHYSRRIKIEVLAATKEKAEECLSSLRALMRRLSIYRGRVISIERQSSFDDGESSQAKIVFHRLPSVSGDAIILPAETMRRIERNTVGFFRNAERLREQGYSVKRGLLFHGPPGTGKTRTACWLTHSLPNVTVLLVTGEQLWNIKESCEFARELVPAMLVLEDVDLIAKRRDQNFQTTTLHQLMNEMDGLDPEADILFLLTTNQPEEIEPALANRPGRIDQAIHFSMPDDDCRRRLIELYRNRSNLAINDWGTILRKTDGSSPAFIKELVRKAALIAVENMPENGSPITLTDEHFLEAINEMSTGDGKLTRRLTGFASPEEN